MAKLSNEQELADIYDVLMAWSKGESVSEARFSDRYVKYNKASRDDLLRLYKKFWTLSNAETQSQFPIDIFDGPLRGGPVRTRHV